jgi:hypothetical protein
VTNNALKSLYFAMVHSHIMYCINIYGCANATTLNKLVSHVSHAKYRDHTNPLFKKLGILPLHDLIKYSALKFMHDFKHTCLPFSFNEFHVQAHNLASLKRLPLFNFPRIWNEDNNINKLNPSSNIYLRSVKSALLNALAV